MSVAITCYSTNPRMLHQITVWYTEEHVDECIRTVPKTYHEKQFKHCFPIRIVSALINEIVFLSESKFKICLTTGASLGIQRGIYTI